MDGITGEQDQKRYNETTSLIFKWMGDPAPYPHPLVSVAAS